MNADYDRYMRAFGRTLVRMGESKGIPLELLGSGTEWWMPDPNPIPRLRLFRWWPRR